MGSQKTVTFKALSSQEPARLEQKTFEILEDVGVLFNSSECTDILKAAGAKVEGDLVRFPEALVLQAIRDCPSKVTLRSRDGKHDIVIGDGKLKLTNGFGATYVRDLDSMSPRLATVADLGDLTRVADALDNVDLCLKSVIPQDVSGPQADIRSATVILRSTGKHFIADFNHYDFLPEFVALGKALAGSQDGVFFSLGTTTTTPLRYTDDSCKRLLLAARSRVPLLLVSGGMAGGTSPVSLSGTLAVQNAELLAGITLMQVVSPGTPVICGSFSSVMDMSTGRFVLGAPEMALMNAATAQMFRRWQIPYGYGTGGVTDSPQLDFQAGLEKAMTLLYAALTGVEVIHDAVSGLLGGGMITDLRAVVLDDEMCRMVRRVLKGIDVSDEALGIEYVKQAGAGGEFITSEHTVLRFRKEHFLTRVFPRGRGLDDLLAPRDHALEAAASKVREILSSHQPEPLDACAERAISRVLAKAGLE